MGYPTIEEIEAADSVQLARWFRFLPSPGTEAIGRDMAEFKRVMEEQVKLLNRIVERHTAAGGMTSRISKAIGW